MLRILTRPDRTVDATLTRSSMLLRSADHRSRHASHVSDRLREMWQRGDLCDVGIITAGNVTFHAHSVVLAAGATVFYECLKQSVVASGRFVLDMAMFDAAEIRAVLNFLYGVPPESVAEWGALRGLAVSLGLTAWDGEEEDVDVGEEPQPQIIVNGR